MDPYDDLTPDRLDEEAVEHRFSVDENLARLTPQPLTPWQHVLNLLQAAVVTISLLAVVLGLLFFAIGVVDLREDELAADWRWWMMTPLAVWIGATAVSLVSPTGTLRSFVTDGPSSRVAIGCLTTYLAVIGWFSEIFFRLSWQDHPNGVSMINWPFELSREASLQFSTMILVSGTTPWGGAPNGGLGRATISETLIGVALLVTMVAIAVHHVRRPRSTA